MAEASCAACLEATPMTTARGDRLMSPEAEQRPVSVSDVDFGAESRKRQMRRETRSSRAWLQIGARVHR